MREILAVKEVERNGEKKSFWTRIGVAYENRDGSLNLVFDFFPCREEIKTIQVREKKPKQNNEVNHDNANEEIF